MKFGLDLAPHGWTRVIVLTILGTLCCIAAAFIIDSYSFEESRWQWGGRPWNNVIIPLAVAPPFFVYLLSKLRELAIANNRLLQVASNDGLTSCLTRVAFSTLVDAYLDRIGETPKPFEGALLVIDVDYFKRVNDEFGHDVGDEALKQVADSIRTILRELDLVGRMGGEEFAVFLPGVSPGRTAAVAERLRKAVENSDFRPDGKTCRLTVSVGAVAFGGATSFSELYKTADTKLYAAKRNGRNRVEMVRLRQNHPASIQLN
jgi:diguanylate cyclase